MAFSTAAGAGRVKDRRLRRPLVCLDTAGSSGYRSRCPRRRRPFHPTTQRGPRAPTVTNPTQQVLPDDAPNEAARSRPMAPAMAPDAGSRTRNPEAPTTALTCRLTGCSPLRYPRWTQRTNRPTTKQHAQRPTCDHGSHCMTIIRDRHPATGSGSADRVRVRNKLDGLGFCYGISPLARCSAALDDALCSSTICCATEARSR
jgi:hypothetical protein